MVLPYLLAGRVTSPASASPGGEREGRGGDQITIAFAGDITPGSRYGLPPERARPMFAAVRDELRSADLAIGNLEGTLSVGGASKCGVDGGNCFSFQAPPENAEGLAWAGLDVLSLANNHAYDFGPEGQQQTIAALAEHGIEHTGLPGRITVVEAAGRRVAIVGFAPYPWANGVDDLDRVAELIERAAAEADVVVAFAHLGAEGTAQARTPHGVETYLGEHRGDSRAFTHAAAEAGAEVVVASGPHVLRGAELHDGALIAYSLGNFAGWNNIATSGALGESALLTVTLDDDRALAGGRLIPLRLDGTGVPAPGPEGSAIATVNELSRLDFGEAGIELHPDGSF